MSPFRFLGIAWMLVGVADGAMASSPSCSFVQVCSDHGGGCALAARRYELPQLDDASLRPDGTRIVVDDGGEEIKILVLLPDGVAKLTVVSRSKTGPRGALLYHGGCEIEN